MLSSTMADLLLTNARIWTGLDSQPWADAALIQDGRFTFIRTSSDAPTAGGTTLDVGGRLVVPGLIDGHAHLMQTGMAMQAVDLKGAARRVGERDGISICCGGFQLEEGPRFGGLLGTYRRPQAARASATPRLHRTRSDVLDWAAPNGQRRVLRRHRTANVSARRVLPGRR